MSEVPLYAREAAEVACISGCEDRVRDGPASGGGRATRVGISSTVFGVRRGRGLRRRQGGRRPQWGVLPGGMCCQIEIKSNQNESGMIVTKCTVSGGVAVQTFDPICLLLIHYSHSHRPSLSTLYSPHAALTPTATATFPLCAEQYLAHDTLTLHPCKQPHR